MNKTRAIIGVMGKPGSGKSFLVRASLMPRCRRVLAYDPNHEYDGAVFTRWAEIAVYLHDIGGQSFRVAYRPEQKADVEKFWTLARALENYCLVAEEVETWAKSHWIDPRIENICSFGRHKRQSMIWVSRSPYEVNRDLTRASDVLISFVQTEPGDLRYLAAYTWNRDIQTLGQYEYAVAGDPRKALQFAGTMV